MKIISIILFIFCDIVNLTPTIIESGSNYCSFTKNLKNIRMFSNIWTVDEKKIQIFYKLCGNLNLPTFNTKNERPENRSLAYLSSDGKMKNLGTSFVLINNTSFHSINGELCTIKQNYSLIINLICPRNRNEKDNPVLYFISLDKCKYYINMRNPDCLPNFSVVVHGHYISLNISKNFIVHDKNRNFSVSLGNSFSYCHKNVIACELKDNTTIALLLASTLQLTYNGQANQLLFTGHTLKNGSSKFDKRFHLKLKCNWEGNEYALKYIPKHIQGKNYDFELETSFGCVKYQTNCMVHDNYYIYDLSNLYKDHLWRTKDTDDNLYVMQICGSPNEQMKESCKSSFAQICEINNGSIINRGSIMKPLKVENDIVILEIESGSKCADDPGKLYSTTIHFVCSNKEVGPTFVQKDGCLTFFNWKTPHACPQINVTSCQHIKENYHKCTFNYENAYYDLTALSVNDSKIVNGNNEILIHPCGGINDPSAVCMKDVSIAMKKMNESNIKNRIVSLGKFYGSTLIKNDLVIKYYTGASCGFRDYTSELRFKCSNTEKNPVVTKVDNCHYEILWETFYGCPREKKCSLADKAVNRSMDFTNVSSKAIEFSLGNSSYKFNICQSNYTVCPLNNTAVVESCRYIPFSEMDFSIYAHSSLLNWKLPITNKMPNSVKQIKMHFKCNDSEEFNSSKQMMNDSVLLIEYSTKHVCSSECSRYIHDLKNEYCHLPTEEPTLPSQSGSSLIIGLSVFLCLITLVVIICSTVIYFWRQRNSQLSGYIYCKDLHL